MIQVRLLKPFNGQAIGTVIRLGEAMASAFIARGAAESLDAKPVKKSEKPAPVEVPEAPVKKGRFARKK